MNATIPANSPELQASSEDISGESFDIVRKHIYWSVGVGVVPIPVVDVLGLTAVQLNMLRKLCDYYKQPFKENIGRSIIGTLAGTSSTMVFGSFGKSILKGIPFVGPLLGFSAMSAMSGASTYALGKLFIHHFESGGNLLTFDTEKAKKAFAVEVEKGKKVVEGIVNKK
ncbi:MAG: YcjF family protein [Flavobacteriales bacterium]